MNLKATNPLEGVTLDPDVAGGYQVGVADVDGDGVEDALLLGSSVTWLHSPDWRRLPITADLVEEPIDLAAYDADQDGLLDLVVLGDFSMEHTGSGGSIWWFRRSEDLLRPWRGTRIGSEPTAHRVRWARLDGLEQKALVVAPIMGPATSRPTYDQSGARLLCFRVPENPVSDPWPKTLIDDSLPVLHGLLVFDWDGDGRDELLTASRLGVHLFRSEGTGSELRWSKTRVCAGNQGEGPARGSSEVTVGQGLEGSRFIATIEPWHGNQVVVYRSAGPGALWDRVVLDESLVEGHALLAVDLDGDGADEVYAGYRGGAGGIVRYRQDPSRPSDWERTVVDEGGISCQGMNTLRLPGRGPGLLGIGGRTHNLRLYTPAVR